MEKYNIKTFIKKKNQMKYIIINMIIQMLYGKMLV